MTGRFLAEPSELASETISERRRDSSTGALGRAEACESDVITYHIKFLYRACETAFSIRAATSFGWET